MATSSVFSERKLNELLEKHSKVPGATTAVISNFEVTPVVTGLARVSENESFTSSHYIQCASLSKTVAAAFALEYFTAKGMTMTTSVNEILNSLNAKWTIKGAGLVGNDSADKVTLAMLTNHTALGMHYVYGIPLTAEHQPTSFELISGAAKSHGYDPLLLERLPGTKMSYSGGGFVVLQYLLEEMEQKPIDVITRDFLDKCGLKDFVFIQLNSPMETRFAYGHITPEKEVPALAFPPLAAGALCTPTALATFLCHLGKAYSSAAGSGSISHHTARAMMGEEALLDLGAKEFMGAKIGLGVFVARAGPSNRIMMHQAANDGVRGLYMLCFEGPDAGKGFVILCNGDNPAVLFQCELTRHLLGPQGLNFQGIDFAKWSSGDLAFDFASVKQETIVNRGLKTLVMDAFIDPEAPSSSGGTTPSSVVSGVWKWLSRL